MPVDIDALPSVEFADRLALPRKPGVYFVTDGDGVVYIGQAQSIRDRWRNHHRAVDLVMLDSVRIAWVEQADELARLELEASLTRELRPRLNARWLFGLTEPFVTDPDSEEPMVGASEVIRKTGIPRTTLYRLVDEKKIPVHEDRKPWQKRTRLRFRLSEVRAALQMDAPATP